VDGGWGLFNNRFPLSYTAYTPPGGSRERAISSSIRLSGYRTSPRRQRRPFIRSITHAPDQTDWRPRLFHWYFDLTAPTAGILLWSMFMAFRGPHGPKRQTDQPSKKLPRSLPALPSKGE